MESESKSARKRRHRAKQQLIADLAALPVGDFDRLNAPAPLGEAIAELRNMRADSARQRQMRYVSKHLSAGTQNQVAAALHERDQVKRGDSAHFHEIENWRDRLLAGDVAALVALRERYPRADLDTIARHAEKARSAPVSSARRHRRALFKALSEQLAVGGE